MTNIEIKARFRRTRRSNNTLKKIGAHFEAVESQIDTYFNVDNGRLKIRERDTGAPQLIQYFREDKHSPRPSYYEIVHLGSVERVKKTLQKEHGIRAVVRKKREIWIWEKVRIHFDIVERLGDFIEFEAVMDDKSEMMIREEEVRRLMVEFGIDEQHLVKESYVDLMEREMLTNDDPDQDPQHGQK